jgi:tetratricopeptide (TPR) repeat protein
MRERIFDNGETTISFRQAGTVPGQALVITFQPMRVMGVDEPGFGEEFLLRNGYDVVCVQKRRESWYQDLSFADFQAAVSDWAEKYDDVVMYGSSVGAYAALYYSGAVDARVLALSPLMSLHPTLREVGLGYSRPDVTFLHKRLAEVVKPLNGTSVIVFDPLDSTDMAFIEREVYPAAPSARYVKLRYSGHPSIEAIHEMGMLKDVVLRYLNAPSEFKILSRRAKARSKRLLSNLAAHCERRGKFDAALTLVDRALATAQFSPDLHIFKSRILDCLGREEEALASARTAVRCDPQNRSVRGQLIALLQRQDDLRLELSAAYRVVEEQPQDANAQYRYAKALLALADVEAAERALRRAIDLNDQVAWWKFELADLLWQQNRLEDAERTLGDFLAAVPDGADGWHLLAKCHAAQGREDQAAAAYIKAFESRTGWTWPMLQLAYLRENSRTNPEQGLWAINRINIADKLPNDRAEVYRLKARLHKLAHDEALSLAGQTCR